MNEALTAAIRRICTARNETAVYTGLVGAADAIVGTGVFEFAVPDDDRLKVQATSIEASQPATGRTYPRWTSLPGGALSSDTACLVGDVTDTRSAAANRSAGSDAAPPDRSLCCVPLEGRGVLIARSSTPDAYTDADRELLERLTSVAATTLNRIEADRPRPMLDGGPPRDEDLEIRLEEIADILSHDLRSPITVARGSLEFARDRGKEEDFDRTERALDRIEELIEEVVLIARSGRLIDETSTVDLESVAERTWDDLEAQRATLEVVETMSLQANELGLRHLLQNIMENAIDHAGAEVTVRVGTTDDGFFIEDDGPGIPEQHRDRIFERGYSPSDESSGLGLHIVDRIAEAHGWEIAVRDTSQGGARFVVTGVQRAGG